TSHGSVRLVTDSAQSPSRVFPDQVILIPQGSPERADGGRSGKTNVADCLSGVSADIFRTVAQGLDQFRQHTHRVVPHLAQGGGGFPAYGKVLVGQRFSKGRNGGPSRRADPAQDAGAVAAILGVVMAQTFHGRWSCRQGPRTKTQENLDCIPPKGGVIRKEVVRQRGNSRRTDVYKNVHHCGRKGGGTSLETGNEGGHSPGTDLYKGIDGLKAK